MNHLTPSYYEGNSVIILNRTRSIMLRVAERTLNLNHSKWNKIEMKSALFAIL